MNRRYNDKEIGELIQRATQLQEKEVSESERIVVPDKDEFEEVAVRSRERTKS